MSLLRTQFGHFSSDFFLLQPNSASQISVESRGFTRCDFYQFFNKKLWELQDSYITASQLNSFNNFVLQQACCQDSRCQRLKLTDLLVAPLQHCTKLPLLLTNIRKYTEAEDEVQKLTESISRVEMSLRECNFFLFAFLCIIYIFGEV